MPLYGEKEIRRLLINNDYPVILSCALIIFIIYGRVPFVRRRLRYRANAVTTGLFINGTCLICNTMFFFWTRCSVVVVRRCCWYLPILVFDFTLFVTPVVHVLSLLSCSTANRAGMYARFSRLLLTFTGLGLREVIHTSGHGHKPQWFSGSFFDERFISLHFAWRSHIV